MTIGIAGLGEVGIALATELLRAGHQVRCIDTRAHSGTAGAANRLGVAMDTDPAAFARAVDAVLVMVQGRRAAEMASALIPHLARGTTYADFTAKSARARDAIAALCGAAQLPFADVAIMDPVTWVERPVELLVSGGASDRIVEIFSGTRFSIRIVSAERPVSAELKLLRSIYTKGLTAVLVETLVAAQSRGVRDEIQRSLLSFMQEDFARIIELLVGSSIRHAARRAHEMEDAVALADDILGKAPMTGATALLLREIASLPKGDGQDESGAEAVVRRLEAEDIFGRIARRDA